MRDPKQYEGEPSKALLCWEDIHITAPFYRCPVLFEWKGNIMVICECRHDGSADTGRISLVSWLTPERRFYSLTDRESAYMSPVVIADEKRDQLMVLANRNSTTYKEEEMVNDGKGSREVVSMTLHRELGWCWNMPSEVAVDHGDWWYHALSNGRACIMRDGTYVVPAVHAVPKTDENETLKQARQRYSMHLLVSEDGGKTWGIEDLAIPFSNEATVIETSPGYLLISARNENRKRGRMLIRGKLGGPWDHVVTDYKFPVCHGDLVQWRNERIMSVPFGPYRENLGLVKLIAGKAVLISTGPAAYSSMLVRGDVLHIVYEANNYERLRYGQYDLLMFDDEETTK